MNNIMKYMAGLLLAGTFLAGCSPEEFKGADEQGLPTMDGVDYTLDVDREVNQVTAVMPAKEGCYPVWIINGATYSTLPTTQWANKKAGTYDIELHLANRNGISQAGVKKTFTFDHTLIDWKPYYERLNGKEWRIKQEAVAHLACGPTGTSGVEWWKAQPDEKAEAGVYDDRVTFNFARSGDEGGSYTYTPGDGGTMYVNTGCTTVFPADNTNDGKDYMAHVAEQQSTFTLESGTWTDAAGKVEDCVYVVFPAKTQFPYVSNDDQWANPRFRVEKITSKELDLVYDNGSIAWHFTLTSEANADRPQAFNGYKYDSDCNMWKSAAFTNDFFYVHGDAWEANTEPIGFTDKGNGSYTVSLPQESNLQWQAQVKFLTDMASNAATKYDFSMRITASQDIRQATVKVVADGDDNNFYFADCIDLAAGETYVFYKDGMAGIDMSKINLILDFGGAPAGSEVQITDMVFKEHDCDDGAGHPDETPSVTPPAEETAYVYNTDDNLWKTVDSGTPDMFFFYADGNWAPYAENPGFVHNGNKYTITLPQATVAAWQAQIAFNTTLSCAQNDTYDFGCVMTPNVDLKNVTVKLVKTGTGNEGIFFFTKQIDLTAGEENIVKLPAQVAPEAMDKISLYFDFGGNPASTEVVVKDIVFKKTAK